jgi:hypothetical protein
MFFSSVEIDWAVWGAPGPEAGCSAHELTRNRAVSVFVTNFLAT